MQNIILFLKGIIIGLGKIIPGVSGSMLAFSLGVYEKAIYSLTSFFKDLKNNILFLGTLGLGVIVSILLFSNIISYLLNKYYLYTLIFFIGLIMGTIPYIIKKVKITKKRNISFILIAILIVYLISIFKNTNSYFPQDNILNYLYIIFLGFLDALTMIIPGISGTATFMMLGVYKFILSIFSNPFAHLKYTILFFLGILIGIIIVSKLISFFLRSYQEQLYLLIIGFSLSSIIYLIINILNLINLINIIPCLILLIIGFIISYKLEM